MRSHSVKEEPCVYYIQRTSPILNIQKLMNVSDHGGPTKTIQIEPENMYIQKCWKYGRFDYGTELNRARYVHIREIKWIKVIRKIA